MLGGLRSQRPTLGRHALVHARDLQFDLGNRLGQLGDLLPEQPTLRRNCWTRTSRSGLLTPGSATIGNQYPPTRDGYPQPWVPP
jgi:hypothetical protein